MEIKSNLKHLIFTSYKDGNKGINEIYTSNNFPLVFGGNMKVIIEINSHFFYIKFNGLFVSILCWEKVGTE